MQTEEKADLKCDLCGHQTEHTVAISDDGQEWECSECGKIEHEKGDE